MKDIAIHKATTNDLDQVYPFFKKCISELFPQFTPATQKFYLQEAFTKISLKKDLAKKKKYLYLAFNESALIGILLVDKSNGGVGFADWLAVDPNFQKHGIASSLLTLWEKDVISEGGHVTQLWTSKHNIPFYKNRGYILIGEFPQAWFGIDYYHFYKPLALPEEKNYLREYLAKKKINSKKRSKK